MTSLSPSASSLSSSDDVASSLTGGQRTSPTNSVASDLSSPPAESKLQCTICSDTYRSPRLLHCLHTFCAPCLESLVISADTPCVSCPECHFITKLPSNGVSGLLLDYGMARLVAASSAGSAPRSRMLCTACKGTENFAQAECFDCANYLCGTCVQAHQRMHCFNRHRVQSLDSRFGLPDAYGIQGKSTIVPPVVCPGHLGERLDFFCITCDIPVCKDCIIKTHPKNDHEIVGIAEIFQREVAALNQLKDHAQAKAEELSDHRAAHPNTGYHSAQVAIEETFQFYVQILKERRDELLQNLDAVYEERHVTVKLMHERRRRLINVCQFMDRLLSYGNEAEILASKRQVMHFIDAALSFGPCDFASATGEIQFINNYQAIQSSVQNSYGYIQKKPLGDAPAAGNLISRGSVGNGLGALSSANSGSHRSIPSISGMGDGVTRNGTSKSFSLAPGPANNGGQLAHVISAPAFDRALPSIGDCGLNSRGDSTSNGSSKQGSPTQNSMYHSSLPFSHSCSDGSIFDNWKWTDAGSSPSSNHESFFNLSSDTLVGDDAKAFAGMSPARQTIRRIKMPYVAKFGDFGTQDGQFSEPSGVAVNGNRDILVADTNNHRVQIFDHEGRFKFAFGECGKRDGQMLYPNRLAVARNGDVVVTERSPTHQIQVYNQYGVFVRKFGADILQHPRGITVDHRGRVIVVECKVMRVVIFEPNGRIYNKFSCSQQLEFPNGVATNDNDEIFISDNRAHCVKVFNYHGIYLRQIGGEGVTNFPIGVCITERGYVVVADNHNNFNLTLFRQDGTLLSAYESRVKHAQCFDVTLMDEGSVVLASKDYKVYVYRFGNCCNQFPIPSESLPAVSAGPLRTLNMNVNMNMNPGDYFPMKSMVKSLNGVVGDFH